MRPCFAALVLALASPLAAQPFTPVVVDTTATGSGPVVWADLDGDGRLDLIKNSFYTHALVYRGGPHGTWTRVEGSPLSERPDMTLGLAVADIDNDGDLDLFESTANHRFGYDLEIGSLLWRNMRGTFTRTETGPLGAVNDVSSNGGAWADYDADGDLDLMVAVHDLWSLNPDAPTSENVLFENTGAGAFRRNTTALPDSPGDADLRPIWADYDGDGDLDLSIPQGYFETAPAHRRSDFFRNQLAETGSATFQHDSTSAFTRATTNTTSLSWVDYDNDGDLDLYLCAFAPGDRPPTEAPGLPNQLWTNVNGTFVRATEGPHVTDAKLTTGHIWLDADNDGDLDLFATNWTSTESNGGNDLYLNDGPPHYTFKRHEGGDLVTTPRATSGMAAADYDRDGDIDLYLSLFSTGNTPERDLLFRNDAPPRRWIRFRLEGGRTDAPSSTGSNRSAIGATVRVRAVIAGRDTWQRRDVGVGTHYTDDAHLTAHVGLGDASKAAEVIVEWPSGMIETFHQVEADAEYRLREGHGHLRPTD